MSDITRIKERNGQQQKSFRIRSRTQIHLIRMMKKIIEDCQHFQTSGESLIQPMIKKQQINYHYTPLIYNFYNLISHQIKEE